MTTTARQTRRPLEGHDPENRLETIMTSPTPLKNIPGDRMAVRVIQEGDYFRVQYEYSRKNGTWINVARRDGRYLHTEKSSAVAHAKRVSARNN